MQKKCIKTNFEIREPYIMHPLEVAIILTTFNAGPITIAAGLLHDVLEDTNISYQEFKNNLVKKLQGL